MSYWKVLLIYNGNVGNKYIEKVLGVVVLVLL